VPLVAKNSFLDFFKFFSQPQLGNPGSVKLLQTNGLRPKQSCLDSQLPQLKDGKSMSKY
jgi:hypothetical protein